MNECLEDIEEFWVPGKFSVYAGNDLHCREHLQLLSFAANQLEEKKMNKMSLCLQKSFCLLC